MVGRRLPVSVDQLLGVAEVVRQLDERRSLVDKIRGAFSFVNIVWGAAVIGILCTVAPTLRVLILPLSHLLTEIWLAILVPVARFIHENGALEATA